ncbi:MAG: hypothetical protein EOP86_24445, partial [Verrucomicrobiaceae bacterium]
LSAADGGGKSLELVNPARPHDVGQNWRPSVPEGGTPGAAAMPVLNEIYFHPPQPGGQLNPTGPEDLSREWIEISNPGLDDVNLAGWKIGRGITFTFAAGQVLPAGGYAVVCANPGSFAAAHPGVKILDGVWAGDLSNIDDVLELAHPSGTVGLSAADGGGKSLELVNPARPHDVGQNWRPSVPEGGTPGAANSRFTADAAPFILKTGHRPVVPVSSQSVRVTAEVTDEAAAGLTVSLKWRVSALTPPAFSSIAMHDDGLNGDDIANDNIFAAAVPAQADQTVVEYYVEAADAGGHARSWPAPTNDGGTEHLANALYQVDNSTNTGAAPLYRIVMPAGELDALDHQNFSSNNRTAQKYLCAFVTDVLGAVEVRQQSGIRIRGNGSRSSHPRSVRVDFLNDEPWQNNNAVNINGRYTYLQTIGARLAQSAGIGAADVLPVSVRFNGQNRAAENYIDPVNGAGSAYSSHFGLYASVEPVNRDYIKHHFPDAPGGNLYTKRGGAGAEWRPAGNDAGSWPQHYIGEGWEKQNNTGQLDFADLHHFISVMSVNAEVRGPEYLPNVSAVLDLPQWLHALAVETFLTDGETKIFNGRDDDYSFLHGPDGKMRVLTHDFDTILGGGDSSAIGINRLPYTLFDIVEEGKGGDIFDKLIPLFDQPAVIQDYYRNLRALLVEGPFSKAPF